MTILQLHSLYSLSISQFFTLNMKACKLLHITSIADYDAAAKRSSEKTVRSLRSTMTQDFGEIPRSPEGQEASVMIVRNILKTAEVQV